MTSLSVEFKGYEKVIRKHNLFLSDFDDLDRNYTITMREEKFEKLGRKHFPVKATETIESEISARQYACYMTSVGGFKDRVEQTYTEFGYKPYKLTCISPNKETKIVRTFNFKFKRK